MSAGQRDPAWRAPFASGTSTDTLSRVAGATCREWRSARVGALACVVSTVLAGVGLWSSTARAATTAPSSAQIAATQQQVTQLEATIGQQLAKSDTLDQQYDAAETQAQTIQAQVAATTAAIASTEVRLAKVKAQMVRVAINAYVFSSTDTTTELFTSPATKSDALGEYEDSVIGNVGAISDALEATQAQLVAQQGAQQAEQQQALSAADQAHALATANSAQTQAAEATLAQVKGTLAQQIALAATVKAQQAAAAASAAKTHAAAQAAASTAATAAAVAGAVGGSSASAAANQAASQAASATGVTLEGSTNGSAAGRAAVAAAETQLGVPYVYGGENPGVGFDCSGLTQWAWAQAGVTIPRTSETQWSSSFTQVPLNALEPGDLVFSEGSPPGHVVMYVGPGSSGSQVFIEAPHTGEAVQFTSYPGPVTGAWAIRP